MLLTIVTGGQRTRAGVLALGVILGSTACSSHPFDCRVMRPTSGVAYRILSRYHHSPFGVDCRSRTVREIMIEQTDYGIYAQFVAAVDPKLALGVIAKNNGRFSIAGTGFRTLTSAEIAGPETIISRLSRLPTLIANFQVVDEQSGVLTPYQIRFDLVDCTCRGYDGP